VGSVVKVVCLSDLSFPALAGRPCHVADAMLQITH